jgi:hypothetical protein
VTKPHLARQRTGGAADEKSFFAVGIAADPDLVAVSGFGVLANLPDTCSRGNAFRRSGTLAYGRPAIRVASLL